MAPKGKKGKKAGDDWDEGLGESADPIAQAEAEAKAADAAEEEETGGGGLMAALRKNKEKRKKKGKNVGPDDLEGEGDTVTPTVDESLDLAAKAPVEATMDDDDLFGGPAKKGKGGKGGKQQPAKQADADAEEETGGVKTKAQKEKEKKEREKQRKKEQVCLTNSLKFTFE
jgi:translation initiation factor 5B